MELYDKKFVYFEWDDILEGKKGFFGDSINHLKQNVKDNRTMWFGEICHNVNTNTDYPFGFIDESGSSHCFRFCYYDPYYDLRKPLCEGKTLQWKNKKDTVWSTWTYNDMPSFDEYTDWRIKPEETKWYITIDEYGLSRTNSKEDERCVLFEGTEEECIQWSEKHKKLESILLAWKKGKTVRYKEGNKWIDWMINEPPRGDSLDYWKEWRIRDDDCKGCMKYNYCENKDGIRCKSYCTEVKYVPFDSLDEFITKWEEMNPGCTNRPKCAMPMIWVKRKRDNTIHLVINYYPDGIGPRHSDVGTDDEHLTLKELLEDYTFLDGSIIGKRG